MDGTDPARVPPSDLVGNSLCLAHRPLRAAVERRRGFCPGRVMQRLILDISTIARWTGPPVGIVQVEYELALHAAPRRPDVQLTFYDPVTESLRALRPEWQ